MSRFPRGLGSYIEAAASPRAKTPTPTKQARRICFLTRPLKPRGPSNGTGDQNRPDQVCVVVAINCQWRPYRR